MLNEAAGVGVGVLFEVADIEAGFRVAHVYLGRHIAGLRVQLLPLGLPIVEVRYVAGAEPNAFVIALRTATLRPSAVPPLILLLHDGQATGYAVSRAGSAMERCAKEIYVRC